MNNNNKTPPKVTDKEDREQLSGIHSDASSLD